MHQTPQQTNQKQYLYELSPQKQLYSESTVYGKNQQTLKTQTNLTTGYSRSLNPVSNATTGDIANAAKAQITTMRRDQPGSQPYQGQPPKRYAGSEMKHQRMS